MIFIINGLSHKISRDDILNKTSRIPPKPFDGRNKYYVELHGLRYPIKQPIHLVTGLSYTGDFGAQDAHRILKKLGFTIHTMQVEEGTRSTRRVITNTVKSEGTTKLAVTLEKDEDGYIVVSCPALPGCYTQGRTEEEAIANIKEAIRGYIASMRRHGEPIPAIKDIREVEVLV
jgi:antitoxin HicB